MEDRDYLILKERFLVLLLYIIFLYFLSGFITDVWIPTGDGESLWFISGIGYLTFKLLSTPFFTTPSDSLASSVSALLLLWSLNLSEINQYLFELNIFRLVVIVFNLIILVSFSVLILIRKNKPEYLKLNRVCYLISVNLGKGELICTPLVLISIFGFHQSDIANMLLLGFIWIVIVIIEPIEMFFRMKNDLSEIDSNKRSLIGEIERVDSPNIIKVKLNSTAK